MDEPDFIESKPLHPVIPYIASKEIVEILGRISKPCQVFSQNDDRIRADTFCLSDELKFVQPTTPSLVIACYHNLLLLDCQRYTFQGRVLIFDNGRVKGIVIEVDNHSFIISLLSTVILHDMLGRMMIEVVDLQLKDLGVQNLGNALDPDFNDATSSR